MKVAEDCINRNRYTVTSRRWEERAPHHIALARPHLGLCLMFWFPHFQKGVSSSPHFSPQKLPGSHSVYLGTELSALNGKTQGYSQIYFRILLCISKCKGANLYVKLDMNIMVVLELFSFAKSRDLKISSSRASLKANFLCTFIYICTNIRMVTLFLRGIGTEKKW